MGGGSSVGSNHLGVYNPTAVLLTPPRMKEQEEQVRLLQRVVTMCIREYYTS